MGIRDISPAQCILLAAKLAADSNTTALHNLTPARQDVFGLELLYRILLTCLPESLEPDKYITYLHETSTHVYLTQLEEVDIDCSSVENLSEAETQKKLRKLHLIPLNHPSIAEGATADPLIIFLIHRAHKIEAETGLLPHVPALLEPFLDRSKYLKDWFVSAVLPLMRLDFEYYPQKEESVTSLTTFESYVGGDGVQTLLSRTLQSVRRKSATEETVGRDFRGVLGPWIHGSSQRKRRKLHNGLPPSPTPIGQTPQEWIKCQEETPEFAQKLEDWQPVFGWIVERAQQDFDVVVKVVEGWDGPSDVDMGGYQKTWLLDQKYENLKVELRNEYCQSAFASIYAATDDNPDVLEGAHAILVRLASLLDFVPPPDLATSIHLLPTVDVHSEDLESAAAVEYLQASALKAPSNPLTIPKLETFSLLQMLVYSAYQLQHLGYKASVATVARIRFWSDSTEQLKIVNQILHNLISGAKCTDDQWSYVRDTLLWLWHWAIDTDSPNPSTTGAGIFGKIQRSVLEKKILEALCQCNLYPLVVKIYLQQETTHTPPLSHPEVEKVLIRLLLQFYDTASNGNRTRGGMKKASDMLAAFAPHFPNSTLFRKCAALLAATHSMSFYTLVLQHGVPFQPVSIRASEDPVAIIGKILEQNARSYTKLDDLSEIGRNLVVGRVRDGELEGGDGDVDVDGESRYGVKVKEEEAEDVTRAARRVTGMAIDAALAEDDFETAYSYVMNRLTPTTASFTPTDDISYLAALSAGDYRFPSSHPSTTTPNSATTLRHLSQRLDLLSHALLLAPSPALPSVLGTWRRCEEELLVAQTADAQADAAHNDLAQRGPGSGERKVKHPGNGNGTNAAPGAFDEGTTQEPQLPPRTELGRGALNAQDEAPMGLFDVARGAAAALGRSSGGIPNLSNLSNLSNMPNLGGLPSLGGLRAALPHTLDEGGAGEGGHEAHGHVAEAGAGGRVRRRDMVASAVTGGLASGLGWMLGATPVGVGARDGASSDVEDD